MNHQTDCPLSFPYCLENGSDNLKPIVSKHLACLPYLIFSTVALQVINITSIVWVTLITTEHCTHEEAEYQRDWFICLRLLSLWRVGPGFKYICLIPKFRFLLHKPCVLHFLLCLKPWEPSVQLYYFLIYLNKALECDQCGTKYCWHGRGFLLVQEVGTFTQENT